VIHDFFMKMPVYEKFYKATTKKAVGKLNYTPVST